MRGSVFMLMRSLQSHFPLHVGVIPCSLAERVSNLTQYNDFSLIFFLKLNHGPLLLRAIGGFSLMPSVNEEISFLSWAI